MRLVFAYLDPGSASIVFQAVIAGIIAVPVIFRNKITAFIRTVRGGSAGEVKETVAEPTSTTDTPAT
jgi:hypothetical protein